MKTVSVHRWGDAKADVWRLDKGDKIERHNHPFSHSTGVVQGRTKVTLFGAYDYILDWMMAPGDPDYAFEPEVEHEIEALEDGTVIVNMAFATKRGSTGMAGGIIFEEHGTIAAGGCF
jgi:quercetin dioxygenase-like cupin family protein